MDFVVKRSEWYRGRGVKDSRLLNADGKKCCLGFFCLAAGFMPSQIMGMGMPAAVIGRGEEIPESLQHLVAPELSMSIPRGFRLINSPRCTALARINDDEKISDMTREQTLTERFAQLGHHVTFVD